jgi:hypothetical protein
MKIAVVGSRSFDDYSYLHYALLPFKITEIVSGGAKGADSLAETYARTYAIPMKIFYPDWDKYGKSAGFRRNQQIVDYADIVVAFWDGESKGTKHSIDIAVKQNKQVIVYTDWKGKNG